MIKMRGIIPLMGFIFLVSLWGNAQTLSLREICDINYQTDYTSIADRKPEDLFPKGETVGFVHFYRGISLLRQRAYQESIFDFKSALGDTSVSRSLCNLYLGIAFMQLNQPDSIFSMYSIAMKVPVADLKKPEFWDNTPYIQENTFAAYLLGTYYALNHTTDTLLIESLFKYATKDPKFYDAFYNYGTYYYFLSRYGNAINLFLKARELNQKDDAKLLLCMGYLYRLVGDNSQSLKTYDLLISKQPNHAAAYNNKGCVEAYIEKYPSSVKNLGRAISKNKHLIEGWFNRGIVYLKMKKYHDAMNDLTMAIQLKPDFGDAYYYRGFAKKTNGDLAGSIADFTRALELKKR
ncbi:MAG: tetratricopeptide repeat protein [Bacteroidales bacterium]|nr:tetratricopeptide repeat protein [Bacteroidales bacterium]MDD4602467.1 tetratricopeptide repeat protein [Bacteroidales bacterium]